MGGSEPPSNTWSLGPSQVLNPDGISVGSAVFARLTSVTDRQTDRQITPSVFSERELTFTFAICYRPSVCLSSVCLSSVTLVHPTQAVQIFGNISTAFGTLAIR